MFGCHWPLMPSLTAELFGLRHFAANQSPISFATAMGSLVLSQQLTARCASAWRETLCTTLRTAWYMWGP